VELLAFSLQKINQLSLTLPLRARLWLLLVLKFVPMTSEKW
jgi:hypothetical protein